MPLPRPTRTERVVEWLAAQLDVWKLRVRIAERFAGLERLGRERLVRGFERVRAVRAPLRRNAGR